MCTKKFGELEAKKKLDKCENSTMFQWPELTPSLIAHQTVISRVKIEAPGSGATRTRARPWA